MQTGLHPLWKVHCGFQSRYPPQQPSPSGSGVCCSQLPCSGSGKDVPCYTGYGGVQGGTCPESGFSVCPVIQHFRSQFSSKHLSWIRAWLGRSWHSSISSATVFSFLLQTSWQVLTPNRVAFPYTPHLVARPCPTTFLTTWLPPPPLSACPCFKCLAWNFLCYLTSSPSYYVPFLPVAPCLLPSFSCHFSQGKSSQWHRGIPLLWLCHKSHLSPWHRPLHSKKVQLSTCHCYAKYLNAESSTSPFPQPRVWGFSPLFRGPPLCTSLQ